MRNQSNEKYFRYSEIQFSIVLKQHSRISHHLQTWRLRKEGSEIVSKMKNKSEKLKSLNKKAIHCVIKKELMIIQRRKYSF